MAWILRALVLVIGLLGWSGCRFIDEGPKGKSPLLPLTSAPDTITLEIFSAPVPLGDPQIEELWREVDEQPLPAELRRRMSENGMRAGVVGPHVPVALAQMLKVTDQAQIRERVKEWNEHRKIVIHTIAVGGTFDILEWLAADSGGTHKRFQ